MPDKWLRGGEQRRAQREKRVREQARAKFGIVWQAEDVRRLAVECQAGEHGPPVAAYQHTGQARMAVYAVTLGERTGYARLLAESGEVAELLTAEEWQAKHPARVEPATEAPSAERRQRADVDLTGLEYVNLDALAVHVLALLPRRWLDDTAPRDVRERSFAEARALLRATFADLAAAIERGARYGDAEDLEGRGRG